MASKGQGKVTIDHAALDRFQITDISTLDREFESEVGDLTAWVNSQYDEHFADLFSVVNDLKVRFESDTNPISDEELERILSELPLSMIEISEQVNAYKLKAEANKLKVDSYRTILMESAEGGTKQERSDKIEVELFNMKLLQCAYTSLISRVDRELVYAKELIMGAKKIWTARRQMDPALMAAEAAEASLDDLPERRAYIK